ncbi:MAG TPA: zonular occludens toxin domain-containing protein [Amycolatopsis sp.]|uniref:zonular occludens toxin domain-containing protein n=1 Tax=Amycolatopsis sp. TaxID=37632 RepID=UPI002B45B994|nr:zonular occludens toxin domain-containing protein [Amycolatopsis sp.]HKS46703.1 zonular occludens toxin domain-containing protein [Amycolatopsis sp.]
MTSDHQDRPETPLAEVVQLSDRHSAHQAGDELEPAGEVLEGELVTPEQYAARQRQLRDLRYAEYRRTAVAVVRVTRTAVTHRHTKTAWEHTTYPFKGVAVVYGRWRDAHGASRYERRMKAAEAAGDEEKLRYWQEADVAEKQRRHDRVMDWLKSPGKLAKAAGIAMLSFAGLLLVIGVILAVGSKDITRVIDPAIGVVEAIQFAAWFLTVYGVFLLVTGTVGTVAYLYRQGRKHSDPPQWATAAAAGEGDVMDQLPDEGMVLNALKHVGVVGFTRALKDGWRIQWHQPPLPDGRGWSCEFDLPPAAPVEEFVKRKGTLAHNLRRYEREVWLTEPRASVLRLWIANPGVLTGPVDPWPLLKDLDNAETDYFAGVPVGVNPRGDQVTSRLFEANHAYGGTMGSGKSTLAITTTLGAMLDPIVEIDVVVLAENADYEPMRPRMRSLVTGPPEKPVVLPNGSTTVGKWALRLLNDVYEDLAIRGEALKEHDKLAVTREIARKDPRLRPRIVIIDECQNLFLDSKDAVEAAVKALSTARKYAVTMMFLTPEPTSDSLPRKLMSIISHKACFAIGDQIGNDAVLGTGSYKVGISAVGLEPKTDESLGDVGTCMQRGYTPKPGLMRCQHVDQADKHRVTKRALDLRARKQVAAALARRDLLADTLKALRGEDRVNITDVAARLREIAPGYAEYVDLDGKRLRELLEDAGVRVTFKDGYPKVYADRVRVAIADRDEECG